MVSRFGSIAPGVDTRSPRYDVRSTLSIADRPSEILWERVYRWGFCSGFSSCVLVWGTVSTHSASTSISTETFSGNYETRSLPGRAEQWGLVFSRRVRRLRTWSRTTATCLGSWYITVNCVGNVISFCVRGTWSRLVRVILCSLVNYVGHVISLCVLWDVVPSNESYIVFSRKLRRSRNITLCTLGRGPV